ncbi:cyclic nucleotide-binding domain-containing protein [Xylophilus rhododendri]|uniref:Cyclic nucleotide-binding domain-containing protein n=1 Tax=Xylophilus rhododendri TaxID=2697032 RepID=A0A857IZA9_9BURK|nr:Crp/Fnr family transcriptional regulator [Xylophilus rhododendri]QHI96934.1 cyclic nucleotide-binding domain-containing protein [Xylophilus rhododendri]
MNQPPRRSSLALRGIELFAGLSDSRLDQLAQDCAWHQVAARHPLLLRSSAGDAAGREPEVFFIVSGQVRIAIYSAGGRQVTFRDHGPGELFGDLAAIDEGPRSADVFTLEPCTVASLGRGAFMALMRDEPVVAERMLRRLAALVRQLSERVIELSTLAVGDRLQAELLRLAREVGVTGKQARLEPAPRHAALASQISTNREQVTRELALLVRAGLLQKEAGALVVTDVEALARRVGDARG